MPDQPKTEKQEQPSATLQLDEAGLVQIVTTGPITDQVVQHFSNMLREWHKAGQTFTIVTSIVKKA